MKIFALTAAAATFLLGGVNLYPCAAGAETAGAVKKSCHAKTHHETPDSQGQKKSEKPCCSLHCYNPAHVEPLVKMHPPATAMVAVENEIIPFTSVSFSPPLPPPRHN